MSDVDQQSSIAGLFYDFAMQMLTPTSAASWVPRKLSHQEARMEQLVYWSQKSIPERLAAGAVLTRRMNAMRGLVDDESEADFTPRRVRRQRG